MQLKRYSREELIPLLSEIFYNYMISSEKNSVISNAQKLYNKYQEQIRDYKETYMMLSHALTTREVDNVGNLKESLSYIKEGLNLLTRANVKTQKEHYLATHRTDYSRSKVRIPLNKKINSFYDDFYLDVVFYDDVCTPCGKYQDYLQITSKEERINFFKCNTEITHLALIYAPQRIVKAAIEVTGNLNTTDKRVQEMGITLLDSRFSDFKNLTLSDTSSISNNDLKQFIQSKIDMDKEDLTLLTLVNIRGDLYKIYKDESTNDMYIRYVCRGTGRVYYNKLNVKNLEISEEFKENDYESYARAWWNLNTLGSPTEGKPVIRL